MHLHWQSAQDTPQGDRRSIPSREYIRRDQERPPLRQDRANASRGNGFGAGGAEENEADDAKEEMAEEVLEV